MMNPVCHAPRADSPAGLRILVVDGTCPSGATASLLKRCYHDIVVARSAQAALDILGESASFDLLIAHAATLGLKSMSPDSPSSRLLAASCSAKLSFVLMGECPNEDDVSAGMRAGAADFLELPLTLSKVEVLWQHATLSPMCSTTTADTGFHVSDVSVDDLDVFDTFSSVFAGNSPDLRHCHSMDGDDHDMMQGWGSGDDSVSYMSAACPASSPLQVVQQYQHQLGASLPAGVRPGSSVTATLSGGCPPGQLVTSLTRGPSLASSLSCAASPMEQMSSGVAVQRVVSPAAVGSPPASSSCVGSKRKSCEMTSAGSRPENGMGTTRAPAAARPGHAAAATVPTHVMPAVLPSPPMLPPAMPPMVPPMARPWSNLMPLPPGQVWGQPMNPTAVAPGITPPIPNLPPMPPPPMPPAFPWGMHGGMHGGPAPFPGFPGPMMGPMMPFMHSMMAAMRPFLSAGFGAMMPMRPPMLGPHVPLQPTASAPPVQVNSNTQLPPSATAVSAVAQQAAPVPAPVAAPLPLNLIMPPAFGGVGGRGAAGPCGGDGQASMHLLQSLSDEDGGEVSRPVECDAALNKMRKSSSDGFLPSLELLLWEDLQEEDLTGSQQQEQRTTCSAALDGCGNNTGNHSVGFPLDSVDFESLLPMDCAADPPCLKGDKDAAFTLEAALEGCFADVSSLLDDSALDMDHLCEWRDADGGAAGAGVGVCVGTCLHPAKALELEDLQGEECADVLWGSF